MRSSTRQDWAAAAAIAVALVAAYAIPPAATGANAARAVAALALGALIALAAGRTPMSFALRVRWAFVLLTGFALWYAATRWWALDPGGSMVEASRVSAFVLLAWAAHTCIHGASPRRLLLAAIAAVGLYAALPPTWDALRDGAPDVREARVLRRQPYKPVRWRHGPDRDQPRCGSLVDLGHRWYRSELLEGRNRVPLNCGAHTMDLYLKLPHGWRTTPEGTPTDLYMWQQILAHDETVSASTPYTTVIGVPASERASASIDERMSELETWSPTTDVAVRERFLRARQSATAGLLAHASYEAEYTTALGVVRGLEGETLRQRTLLAEMRAALEQANGDLSKVQLVAQRQHRELVTIYNSRGWHVLERLRRMVPR